MKKNLHRVDLVSAPALIEGGILAVVEGGILDFNLSNAERNSTKDVTRKNSGNTFMNGSFNDYSVMIDETGGSNGGTTTQGPGAQQPPAPGAGQQQQPA
jgi:hypothetical protein